MKKNIPRIIFVGLILIVSISSCNFNTRKFLLGCYWLDCVPERSFHVQDWQIPPDFFPTDAKVSGLMISSEGAGEIERRSQSIFWNNGDGIAGYNVYRYRTIKESMENYKNILDGMVDDGTNKSWELPTEIIFVSSTADDFFIGCGNWIVYRCGMLAQYQEYIILFTMVVDDKMTYSDFENIAIYLDEQISSRLYP
jgi:hypothetical protein